MGEDEAAAADDLRSQRGYVGGALGGYFPEVRGEEVELGSGEFFS